MSRKKDDDLLVRWEAARDTGVTRKEFAKSVGMTDKAMDNRLWRAKKRRKEAEEKISHQVDDILDGNYRYVASKTKRIKTLPELLKACEVDLDEWQVDDRHEIGTWEMGRRAEQKKLTWQDGKIIDGQAEDTGKLWIETLYRLRAVLVRRKPKAIHPLISPVRFPSTPLSNAAPTHANTGRILVVPDSQTGYRRNFQTGELTPFHDRIAHSIVMQIAEYDDFDAVTYLGDGLDFSEFSDKFVSEPEFYYTAQPALIEYAWFLSQMKHFAPLACHEMLLGNHEDRVNKMLRKHLYAACQLKPITEIDLEEPYSIRRLLGADELGIKVAEPYPNGEIWHGEYVRCVHNEGISTNPGATVAKMISGITQTTLVGHIHRLEKCSKTIDDYHGRRYVTAASCGCLCHLDYRVPGHKKGQSWQQGFGVVHYLDDSPHVELIPIINGEAIYQGKRFAGVDYSEELSEDTGWNF
jgi:hypothetical protein